MVNRVLRDDNAGLLSTPPPPQQVTSIGGKERRMINESHQFGGKVKMEINLLLRLRRTKPHGEETEAEQPSQLMLLLEHEGSHRGLTENITVSIRQNLPMKPSENNEHLRSR